MLRLEAFFERVPRDPAALLEGAINRRIVQPVLQLVPDAAVHHEAIQKIWKGFINDNLLNQLLREQSSGITAAYVTPE